QVRYSATDVADETQLGPLLATIAAELPPVRGVVHAASVWQDRSGQGLVRPLVTLQDTALEAVFRPKVLGGWLLSERLRDAPLDFFVSFSSAASLLGSAGQGNYAAAGAFLDALAHHQRATGRP